MATTVNSDLIIYNDLAQTSYLERIQDVLELFNTASNGAIVLRNENIVGDLIKRSYYKVGGEIEHRDVNSDSKITAKKIGAGETVGVKVPFKYGPYQTTEEAFKRRGRAVEEFSQITGQDYADAVLEGYIAYAFGALKAAIGNNPAMTAHANITVDGKKTLTKGLRKFGDRASRIALWVMDSATYFDIVDQAITEKVYNETDVVIYGGQPGTLGKPVLVSDQVPADTIFGLQAGAIEIIESQLPGFRSFPINDQENLGVGFRAEGVFNVDILGYSWDETKGGVNPNKNALGNTANWRKHATSDKATAGVLIALTETEPVTEGTRKAGSKG